MTTGRINQVAALLSWIILGIFHENGGALDGKETGRRALIRPQIAPANAAVKWRRIKGGWVDFHTHTRVGFLFASRPTALTRKGYAKTKPKEKGLHFVLTFHLRCDSNKRNCRTATFVERCYTFAIVRYHAAAPAPGPPSAPRTHSESLQLKGPADRELRCTSTAEHNLPATRPNSAQPRCATRTWCGPYYGCFTLFDIYGGLESNH